ncbi:hypothetical protein Taro_002999 [Colocasia esculenta]|uniref:RRM domain-containing protein n=1 Tax=Colocasia esculenta TaxID=4460 RepID=A0A843TMH9_COLES|nr:hypothetical protein [Colocasia esculenta]
MPVAHFALAGKVGPNLIGSDPVWLGQVLEAPQSPQAAETLAKAKEVIASALFADARCRIGASPRLIAEGNLQMVILETRPNSDFRLWVINKFVFTRTLEPERQGWKAGLVISGHHKEKKEEGAEPEVDPERDQRTVFAYQITLKADERDVYEFFSRAGKVRDVRLIMDRNSRRSKGVGYIEFYDVMSVPMAIALSGQNLLGQPVMVKPSEAEKNLVQSTSTTAGAAVMGPGVARRLYVGNLHLNITEDQLRQFDWRSFQLSVSLTLNLVIPVQVFEPFGPVELVQLPVDPETRQCKGFGFIQFARLEDARAAQSLNGQLEIAGRTIKVSAVSEHVGMQDLGTNAGDFDDDEGGGLSLNARSRALLMQKLDRSGITTSVASSLVSPVVSNPALPTASVLGAPPVVAPILQTTAPALVGLPGSGLPVGIAVVPQADTIGVPSECLLLKNMFDPSVETEPDFDLDIKEDVQDECSKFGAVKHIFVDKNTSGFVYLRFDNVTSAMNAQRALHGRWFAGKMISATFMVTLLFLRPSSPLSLSYLFLVTDGMIRVSAAATELQ